jgi:hypothetical protein
MTLITSVVSKSTSTVVLKLTEPIEAVTALSASWAGNYLYLRAFWGILK